MLGDQTLLQILRLRYITSIKHSPNFTFLCICVGRAYISGDIDVDGRLRLEYIMRENIPEHIPEYGINPSLKWWPAKEHQKRIDWIDSMIEKYK